MTSVRVNMGTVIGGRREYRDCRGTLLGLWLHVLTQLQNDSEQGRVYMLRMPHIPQSRIKGFLDHHLLVPCQRVGHTSTFLAWGLYNILSTEPCEDLEKGSGR